MLYTIEDTTLNALGDVVRDKTGNKYVGGLAVPNEEPFYTFTVDTMNIDWDTGSSTHAIYRTNIPIKTALGDRQSLTEYTYWTLECETNDINAFNIWLTSTDAVGATYFYYLLKDGTIYEDVYISGKSYAPQFIIQIPLDKLNSGVNAIFTIKLWACDKNKDYIGIRKLTPLEMIDQISGLNLETGKKLKYIIEKNANIDFTLTAEDLEGITCIGTYTFYDNDGLRGINLPEGITRIDSQSFGNCNQLGRSTNNELVLPSSLTSLGGNAFGSCNSIYTVRILNNTSVISWQTSSDPFKSSINLTTIYVPSNLYDEYCNSSTWSSYKNNFFPVGEWVFEPIVTGSLLFNQSKEYTISLNDFDYTPECSITSSNPEVVTVSDIAINEDNSLITFKVNSLAVEGKATINISINASIKTFEFSGEITVYESFTESSYEVVPVDGATYGFALNDAGYWESQNKKKGNTYALCQINISNMMGKTVYLDCINYAESNYDYGILGSVNQVLAKNTNDDGGIKQSFKGKQSANIVTVEYTDAIGDCFIQVKFKKDVSGDQNNDSIQFKVRFGD